MKQVLVLRAKEQATEFVEALASHGLGAVCLPLIEITATTDWSAIDAAFADIAAYDALVFTSANGVRYFMERMSRADKTCDDLPAGFGLGSKTQATMNDCGMNVLSTDPALDANSLAGEICSFMTSAGFDGVTDMRFLFPCGDKARTELPDALRAHGAVVDPIVVYHNVVTHNHESDAVQRLLDDRALSCVAFFSPSQVDAFASRFPDYEALLLDDVIVAAIGNTTAAAVRAVGLSPHVIARSPDAALFAGEIAAHVAAASRRANN